jgi:hypothetical protein
MYRLLNVTGPEHALLAHPFLPDGEGAGGDGGAGGGGGDGGAGNTGGGNTGGGTGGSTGGQPAGNTSGGASGDTDWKTHARTWEDRAKQNLAEVERLKAENEKFRQQSLSEAEKALEAARAEGEKAGLAKATPLIVQSELKGALAHLPDDQRTALLDGIDPGRFVGQDGAPDSGAIKAWAEKVAPPVQQPRGGGLPLGTRTPAKTTDMNDLIRQHAGITPPR